MTTLKRCAALALLAAVGLTALGGCGNTPPPAPAPTPGASAASQDQKTAEPKGKARLSRNR